MTRRDRIRAKLREIREELRLGDDTTPYANSDRLEVHHVADHMVLVGNAVAAMHIGAHH